MLLVIQKRIGSLPFNFNIINTHDRQTLIYFDLFIQEQILLLLCFLFRARVLVGLQISRSGAISFKHLAPSDGGVSCFPPAMKNRALDMISIAALLLKWLEA